jgi:hypothetical protein
MHKGEKLDRLAQLSQNRILFLLVGFKEMQNGPDGIQAFDQSEYLLNKQIGSFHFGLFKSLSVVYEMLNGKVIFLLRDLKEFLHQLQFKQDGFMIGLERHPIHPLLSWFKQAVGFYQLPDPVKTDFGFKLYWVDQIKVFCPSKVIKKASPL